MTVTEHDPFTPAGADSPPSEVMRRYLDAVHRGDFAAAFALVADDVTLRVPGRSPLAGVRYGRQAALDYIRTVLDLLDDGGAELASVRAFSSDEHFVLVLTERLRRHGVLHVIPRANVYRVDAGRVVEITIYEGDQYAVDALLAEALG